MELTTVGWKWRKPSKPKPLERMIVGWKGVIPLKARPASAQHTSLLSQITHEQQPPMFQETGALRPQDTDSMEQCRWADKLRRTLEAAYIDLGDFMLDNISPGQPDDRVGETLDDEYWRWLPPRERRQSVPPRQAL